MKRTIIFLLALSLILMTIVGVTTAEDPSDQPVQTRTEDRIVLLEHWTSAPCGACKRIEPVVQQLQDDYGYDQMVTISYHGIHYQSIEPYRYIPGEQRANSYYGFDTVPVSYFDGVEAMMGTQGSDFNTNYEWYNTSLNTRMAVPAEIIINATGYFTDDIADVKVSAMKTGTVTSSDHYLRVVLIENGLSYASDPMEYVARDYKEVAISLNCCQVTQTLSFDLDPSWNTANLAAVAFIQSGSFAQTGVSDKEVLNSCIVTDWISNTNPQLTITSPTASEVWEGNDILEWTATDEHDDDGALLLDIYYKNSQVDWTILALNEPNDGAYGIDSTSYNDDNYNFKLVCRDTVHGKTSVESPTFTINNPDPPEVTVTYPTIGATVNGNVTVTWDSSDPEDDRSELNASVWFTLDSLEFFVIQEDLPDTGSTVWDTSGLDDGTNYKIKVKITDTHGLTAEHLMYGTFTVDNLDNPLITLETDLDDKVISGDQIVTWTANDDEDSKQDMKYSLYLSSDGGTTWDAVFEDNDYLYSYTIDTITYPNGDYLLKVVVEDTSGLTAIDVTNSPFTIYNNDAPSVAILTPTIGTEHEEEMNITYSALDNQDAMDALVVSIYYSTDSIEWYPIIENEMAKGFHVWNILPLDNGEYYLKVIIEDTQGDSAEVVSDAFDIENNLKPIISSIYPFKEVSFTDDILITWTATDPNDDDLLVSIYIGIEIAECCPPDFETVAEDIPNTGLYSMTKGTFPPGTYYLRIRVTEDGRDQPLYDVMTSEEGFIIVNTTVIEDGTDGGSTMDGTDGTDGGSTTDGTDGGSTTDGTSTETNDGMGAVGLAIGLIALVVLVLAALVVVAIVVVMKRQSTPAQQADEEAEEMIVEDPAIDGGEDLRMKKGR